jgi:L-malate glycosyltransferase
VSEAAGEVPALRIAVLGDFDGIHTRRWLEVFVQRGHDVHAISFYRPNAELPNVTVHVLRDRPAPSVDARPSSASMSARRFVPPSLLRFVYAWRYQRAGLRRVVYEIAPDVFHAHYAVEHGFFGSFTGYRPYVVSAWGSDLLVVSRTMLGRLIAQFALRHADLVTGNDASLVQRAVELGVPAERAAVVHLGIERLFLDAGARSINLRPESSSEPTVFSDRALEPLYNVDVILRAFARVRERMPEARLRVAHDGSQRRRLEALALELGLTPSVQFLGRLEPSDLAGALASAQVYVSVPSSDSLALSNLEAMAAGAFPVVSDLPSVDGWVTDGVNGLRVPAGDVRALADALHRALSDPALRRSAVEINRRKVDHEGLREANMLLMERHYRRLAGHPMAGEGEAI